MGEIGAVSRINKNVDHTLRGARFFTFSLTPILRAGGFVDTPNIHGCSSAEWTVIRSRGSTQRSLRTISLAVELKRHQR